MNGFHLRQMSVSQEYISKIVFFNFLGRAPLQTDLFSKNVLQKTWRIHGFVQILTLCLDPVLSSCRLGSPWVPPRTWTTPVQVNRDQNPAGQFAGQNNPILSSKSVWSRTLGGDMGCHPLGEGADGATMPTAEEFPTLARPPLQSGREQILAWH